MSLECSSSNWSKLMICGISKSETDCFILKSLAISRISGNLECTPRTPHTLSSSYFYPFSKLLKLLRFWRISGDWSASLSKILSTSISDPWTKLISPKNSALRFYALSFIMSEISSLARLAFLVEIAERIFKREVSSPNLSILDTDSIYSWSFSL